MRAYEFLKESIDRDIIATYNNPELHYDEGGTVNIYKHPDGYYGDTNEFDFVRADLESLKATLTQWGYTQHVYGQDLMNEGDVVDTTFMQKLGQKRGMMHNPDAEPPVSRKDGEPFDRFETEDVSDKVARIVGVRSDGYKEIVGTSQKKLAYALAGAYNAGGYSSQSIEKVPLKSLFKEENDVSPEIAKLIKRDPSGSKGLVFNYIRREWGWGYQEAEDAMKRYYERYHT